MDATPLEYVSPEVAGADRARRVSRTRRRLGRSVGIACAVAVALCCAWLWRQPRSADDVRAWVAALPKDATAADVVRLLDSRGVRWVRAPAMKLDPGDRPGIEGTVEPFLGDYDYIIDVYFDKDDHVRSFTVESQFLE